MKFREWRLLLTFSAVIDWVLDAPLPIQMGLAWALMLLVARWFYG